MISILAKIFSFAFVIIIYMFIIKIIQMIYRDIEVMSRHKNGDKVSKTYLKLINLRSEFSFDVFESYPITKDTVIGRDKRCHIRIDDPFMSSRHAEIIVREGVHYLNDLESTNGTFLNGDKVTGDPIEILNGDKIEIGQVTFIFVTETEDEHNE